MCGSVTTTRRATWRACSASRCCPARAESSVRGTPLACGPGGCGPLVETAGSSGALEAASVWHALAGRIQHLAHPARQVHRAERLLKKRDAPVEHGLTHLGLIGIAGHEQDAQLWPLLRQLI